MKNSVKYILLLAILMRCTSLDGQTKGEILNKGIGGNTSKDLLDRLDRDVLEYDPDIVLLMVGTNDLLNSRKMISLHDYGSNLRMIISGLKEKGIEVVLISPPPVDTAYLFQRHDRKKFTTLPNEKLEMARDLLRRLSKEYDDLFIDVYQYFKDNGIPDHNLDEIIRNENNSNSEDGVHLTKEGNQFLGSFIFRELLESGKIKKASRIICFGDSLTFGAAMEGKGTSTGDTYPAVLKKAVEKYFQH